MDDGRKDPARRAVDSAYTYPDAAQPPSRMSCTDFCRELGSLRKFLPFDSSLRIEFARMSSLIPASCPPSRSGFPGSRAPTPARADDARISSFRLSPRDGSPGRPGRGSLWRVNTPRVESDDNCVAQREKFAEVQPELPIWRVEQRKNCFSCHHCPRKRRLFAFFFSYLSNGSMKHTFSPLRLIEGKRRFTVKTSVAAATGAGRVREPANGSFLELRNTTESFHLRSRLRRDRSRRRDPHLTVRRRDWSIPSASRERFSKNRKLF